MLVWISMKVKLKPKICYMAGLSTLPIERNAVGVETSFKEIEEQFIELALNVFHIEPSKIVIEEKENKCLVYFYHSRIARQLAEIRDREDRIFRVPSELSRSYVAGIFDSRGRRSAGGITIRALSPKDDVMLANLGIHTRNGSIMNISALLSFIEEYSLLLRHYPRIWQAWK